MIFSFLTKLATMIVWPLIILGLAAFSIHNRTPASIDLWPLPYYMDMPVYLLVLAGLALGFILGGLKFWITSGIYRQQAKTRAKKMEKLKLEVARLENEIHTTKLEKK